MGAVESLLDKSIASEGYEIRYCTEPYGSDHLVDLSKIDFDALRAKFEPGHKRTEAEKLDPPQPHANGLSGTVQGDDRGV